MENQPSAERKWYKFYWTHGLPAKTLAGYGFAAVFVGAILRGGIGVLLLILGWGLLAEALVLALKKKKV